MTQEKRAQVWAIRFDDDTLQVRELPVDVITAIARRNGVGWFQILEAPATDLAVARDVIEEAARHTGQPVPTLVSTKDLIAYAEAHLMLVDDDAPELPDVITDGPDEPNPTNASGTAG